LVTGAAAVLIAAVTLPFVGMPEPGDLRLGTRQPAAVDSQAVKAKDLGGDRSQGVTAQPAAAKVVWPSAGTAAVLLDPATSAEARQARASSAAVRQAGQLPVYIGQGSTARTEPATVDVAVLDRAALPEVLRDSVVVRLRNRDARAGQVTVGVEYSGFAGAFGGDFAGRLHLVSLPECALSTPEAAGCAAAPLGGVNDQKTARVTGAVDLAGATGASGTLVALTSEASGATGDYSATSLSASATWTAGGSSGDFAWNYAMKAPPALGGPEPTMALAYSSSSVDGRSEATNNQPSWIGQGFEYWPGYIERRYTACSSDMGGTANNTVKTGDLCWGTDNAVLNLNGSGAELVKDDATGVWKPKADDGSKIERLDDTAVPGDNTVNGAWNNEYWKVTTADGTQYFFGRNRLSGYTGTAPADAVTNSTWTVPVAGNNTGERCRQATFANSFCAEAWRWNLDYVVDVHGNTMSYWYAKQTNKYAKNLVAADDTAYDRGGVLSTVRYGTDNRSGVDTAYTTTKAPTQVVFTPADRCVGTSCGIHDALNWPDTPWDQECTGTTCDNYSPTFWTTTRLSKITTQVVRSGAYSDVDSWTFTHQFPPTGSGTPRGLWLESIVRTGLTGTPIDMPEINFDWVALDNRVDTYNGTKPTMNWHRMSTIWTETGGKISIRYSDKQCVPGTLMPGAAESNTLRCYPVVIEDPDDDTKTKTEYFHKYVVTSVTEADLTGGTDKLTSYEYPGTPAWRFADDDGITKAKFRTWSDYRGYDRVLVREGAPGAETLAETIFFRGMHGSKAAPAGGTRTVTVPAAIGAPVNDEDAFAGMIRQQTVYNGVLTDPVSRKVSVPWQSDPTASRVMGTTTVRARYKGTQTEYASVLLAGPPATWRTTRTDTVFDAYGMPDTISDHGQVNADGSGEVAGDENCTDNTYLRNTTVNLLGLTSRVQTYALPCGTAPTSLDDVIGDVRTSFDNQAFGVVPSKGDATKIERLDGWTLGGGSTFAQESRHGYDAYGREVQGWDVRNNLTTTAFTPASGGPVTLVTSTQTVNSVDWVSTQEVDPAWGTPLVKVDPNGRRTEVVYDAMGRITKVWLANRLRSANPSSPSTEYEYLIRNNGGANAITTRKINAGGSYTTTYNLFDGLVRSRQLQAPSVAGPGTVFTETIYDAAGRVKTTNSAHYDPTVTAGTTLRTVLEWEVKSQSVTEFDRASRAVANIKRSAGQELWRTTITYGGDRVMSDPPDGGTPTTKITDARGHVVELRQHSGGSPAGAYDATTYTYNKKNQLSQVRDTAGNLWKYTYDLDGRQLTADDPDKGLFTTTYNAYGDVATTVDANSAKLVYEYDSLGRKIGLYDDQIAAGKKRSSWAWDPSGAKGQLASSSRWEGVNRTEEYKTRIRGYTPLYASTGEDFVIPTSETGLAGTYTFTRTYKADGSPATLVYPNAGGLGAETLTYTYDATTGLSEQVQTNWPGAGQYVTNTDRTAFGETSFVEFQQTAGSWLQRSYTYDDVTRHLVQQTAVRQTVPQTLADVHTDFDAAENIIRVADTPAGGVADVQCFTNDQYRRLTEAWTPQDGNCAAPAGSTALGGPAPYWHSWSINPIGNRITEVQHLAGGGMTTATSAYPASGATTDRPHATTAVTTAAGVRNYTYDNAGNLTCRPKPGATSNTCTGANSQILAWTSEGRLDTVTDGAAVSRYTYDATGARLISRNANGKTLFLPNMELKYAAGVLTATRYYGYSNSTVAMRTSAGLTWLVTDYQGSQSISVAAAGQAVTRRRQTPYGETRGTVTAWPNGKGFVGGDIEPTGLTHIGARDYDPVGGVFTSVDPVIDYDDPQQLNAYAYSNNSPITMSDPDGLRYDMDSGGGTTMAPAYYQAPSKIIYPSGPRLTKDRQGNSRIAGSTEAGREKFWTRYLGMTTEEIDAECKQVNGTGPVTLFNDFKDGTGPANQEFFQVDNMTMGLRSTQHMVGVREKIAGEIASGAYMGKDEEGNDRFGTGRADYDLPSGDGAKGRILKDLTAPFRDLRDGDINETAEAFVGSFDLDYEIMAVDPDSGKAVVTFHAHNQTDVKSMTRNPLVPKQEGGGNGPATGPWSAKTQDYYWTEVITFPVAPKTSK
jgi:RHS repeat-associated protein